jgi:hypothetical protein
MARIIKSLTLAKSTLRFLNALSTIKQSTIKIIIFKLFILAIYISSNLRPRLSALLT